MVYIVVKDLKNNNVVFDIHYPGPYLKNVLETNVLIRRGTTTEKNLATVISSISNVNMDNIVKGDNFQHYVSPELLNRYFKFSFSENLFFVDPNDVSTEKFTKYQENNFSSFVNSNFAREINTFQNRERFDIKYHYNEPSTNHFNNHFGKHYEEPFASKNKSNSNVNSKYDFLEIDNNGVYYLRNELDMFILRYDSNHYKITCTHGTKNDSNPDNLKVRNDIKNFENSLDDSDKYIISQNAQSKYRLADYFAEHIENIMGINKLKIEFTNIVVSENLLKVMSLFNNGLENGLLENNFVSIRHNKTYGEILNGKNTVTELPVRKPYDEHKSLIREILVKNKVDFSPEPTDTHKDTFTFTFHSGENYILFFNGYYVKAKPDSKPRLISTSKLKELNNTFKTLECLKGYDIFMSPQERL